MTREEAKKEIISLKWNEKERNNTARVGAMYCFHNCDINRNQTMLPYLNDFFVGEIPSAGYSSLKYWKFICKQATEDIPVFTECEVRNERIRQFRRWWNQPWITIPENRLFDTGVAADFQNVYIIESYIQINFHGCAFGGYDSYSSKEVVPHRVGTYGIIPKGSLIWHNDSKTHYISDRLILDFNKVDSSAIMEIEEIEEEKHLSFDEILDAFDREFKRKKKKKK